jgi:hypothetical protein
VPLVSQMARVGRDSEEEAKVVPLPKAATASSKPPRLPSYTPQAAGGWGMELANAD